MIIRSFIFILAVFFWANVSWPFFDINNQSDASLLKEAVQNPWILLDIPSLYFGVSFYVFLAGIHKDKKIKAFSFFIGTITVFATLSLTSTGLNYMALDVVFVCYSAVIYFGFAHLFFCIFKLIKNKGLQPNN